MHEVLVILLHIYLESTKSASCDYAFKVPLYASWENYLQGCPGEVAMIENMETNSALQNTCYVLSVFTASNFFIGLTRANDSSPWMHYNTDCEATWFNWQSGYPRDGDTLAMVVTSGLWRSLPRQGKTSYCCQSNCDPVLNSTYLCAPSQQQALLPSPVSTPVPLPAPSPAPPTPSPPSEYDVRLVGGSNKLEGRVEIFYNNIWGTVCQSFWDISDAEVVCLQLGYLGESTSHRDAFFGEGVGQIWLTKVKCGGNNERLVDCPHSAWGATEGCTHAEDAGAGCTDIACQDVADWIDIAGLNCTTYEEHTNYCATAVDFAKDGVDATQACCVCGGGMPALPTSQPTVSSPQQTTHPSPQLTLPPSLQPTLPPSLQPTLPPSLQPTLPPSLQPTLLPSLQPTLPPSLQPTLPPSLQPTLPPNPFPTLSPVPSPTQQPVPSPTTMPTPSPTTFPTPLITAHPQQFTFPPPNNVSVEGSVIVECDLSDEGISVEISNEGRQRACTPGAKPEDIPSTCTLISADNGEILSSYTVTTFAGESASACFPSGDTDDDFDVVSQVVIIERDVGGDLDVNIFTVAYEPSDFCSVDVNDTLSCQWYDEEAEQWSDAGCEVVDSNAAKVICRCTHLTAFAVLQNISAVRDRCHLDTVIGNEIWFASMVCYLLALLVAAVQLFRILKIDVLDKNHFLVHFLVILFSLVKGITSGLLYTQQTTIPLIVFSLLWAFSYILSFGILTLVIVKWAKIFYVTVSRETLRWSIFLKWVSLIAGACLIILMLVLFIAVGSRAGDMTHLVFLGSVSMAAIFLSMAVVFLFYGISLVRIIAATAANVGDASSKVRHKARTLGLLRRLSTVTTVVAFSFVCQSIILLISVVKPLVFFRLFFGFQLSHLLFDLFLLFAVMYLFHEVINSKLLRQSKRNSGTSVEMQQVKNARTSIASV